jgi:hypothetical protein
VRALALCAAALAAGCAGELEEPERFASCPPGYVEQLFADKCGGMCHAGTTPEAGLDLVSPGVEARLIGETSQTEFCDGRSLVVPEATTSLEHLLVDKLSETPSCGARMPFGREALSANQIECVRRWVDDAIGVEPAP